MFVDVREANFTVLYDFCTCGLNDHKPLEVTPNHLRKTNKGILQDNTKVAVYLVGLQFTIE